MYESAGKIHSLDPYLDSFIDITVPVFIQKKLDNSAKIIQYLFCPQLNEQIC